MPEPNISIQLGESLILPTPFIAASGTLGFGDEAADLTDLSGLGALITPTLTWEPRAGNAPPRTEEVPSGLLYSTGLPNPGLTVFLSETLPRLREVPCPIIVSILGKTEAEWQQLTAKLADADGIAALELNLSPPQLLFAERAAEPLPSETETLDRLAEILTSVRVSTSLPLLAKLPPIGVDIARAADCVAVAGADVVSVGQAFPGIAVRPHTRLFRFPGVVGALSGPAIKPLALYQVWQAAQYTNLPVLGGGGILTLDDALEFIFTGASAVTIGLANLIQPDTLPRLATELKTYLASRNLPDLSSLISSAK